MTTPAIRDALSRPFWDAAERGEFAYQRCRHCGKAQFFPRAACTHCQSRDLDWQVSTEARGSVYALTHVAVGLPGFAIDPPYAVVLVDLDEGGRIMTNVEDNPSDIAIGDIGRITFTLRDGGLLPIFRRDPLATPLTSPE